MHTKKGRINKINISLNSVSFICDFYSTCMGLLHIFFYKEININKYSDQQSTGKYKKLVIGDHLQADIHGVTVDAL